MARFKGWTGKALAELQLRESKGAVDEALKNKYQSKHTAIKAGRRKDLGDYYFRSSWEANYARYLTFRVKQKEIIRWEFEPDTFWFLKIKRGVRSYLPDFKVHELDGSVSYHEVKGYMDQRSRTKLKRMAKYYPDVKIVLVDKDSYFRLTVALKKMLPYWEN